MKKLSEERINKKVIKVELSWNEIQQILAMHISKALHIEGKFKLELFPIKEGSPEYSTGKYRGIVMFDYDYEGE